MERRVQKGREGLEMLKLAGEASLVEQDHLNELERGVCQLAVSSKGKVEDGWAVGRGVESDVEVISNMSTCVDFNGLQRITTLQRQGTG